MPQKIDILIVVGQSLSVGTNSAPPLSVQHYRRGVMLGNNLYNTTGYPAPLSETGLESPVSGAIDHFHELTNSKELCLAIHCGIPGAAYSQLAKGSANWSGRFIPQLKRIKQLGKEVGSVFVSCIHGESDALEAGTRLSYKNNLIQWQKDIEAAVNEELSAGDYISAPFLCCQMSSHAWYAGRQANYPQAINQPSTALAIVDLAKELPSKFKLVTPKYTLPVCAQDGVHLSNAGSRSLGWYHGRVMAAVKSGNDWTSFAPKTILRLSPKKYRIYFDAPVLPLRFDTAVISPAPNQGFTCTDSTSSTFISSVVISGSNCVDITLSIAPTGANKQIQYAWTTGLGFDSGPVSGSRGHLCDSDVSAPYSQQQGSMPNWCPHFTIPLPN